MLVRYYLAVAGVCATALSAVPSHALVISQLESFASTSRSNTTSSSGFDCAESSPSFGQLRTCSTQHLFYDQDSETFYQLNSEAQAVSAFGELKTRSSVNYRPVELFTQDEDGTIVVYTSDPNVEPGEGEAPAARLGNLDAFAGLPTKVQANAFAALQDTWLITGGESGTTGTLALDYQFDGVTSSPSVQNGVNVEPDLFAQSSTTLFIRERDGIDGAVEQTGGFVSSGFNGAVDQLATLELDFVFGEGFAIEVIMRSLSDIFADVAATDPILRMALTSTDFFNTATLADFRVTNENDEEIDFNLVSGSNNQAFQQFSTPVSTVPLPAGAPLLLGALGLLGLLRLRRRVV